jgi:hypothetical protein
MLTMARNNCKLGRQEKAPKIPTNRLFSHYQDVESCRQFRNHTPSYNLSRTYEYMIS